MFVFLGGWTTGMDPNLENGPLQVLYMELKKISPANIAEDTWVSPL